MATKQIPIKVVQLGNHPLPNPHTCTCMNFALSPCTGGSSLLMQLRMRTWSRISGRVRRTTLSATRHRWTCAGGGGGCGHYVSGSWAD
jgi:hypothetical protein